MAKLEVKNGSLHIDGKKVIRAWESYSGWYWFATEKVEERKIGSKTGGSIIDGKEVSDTIWFGFVQGLDDEWGYLSQAELESLKGRVWEIKQRDLVHSGRRNG